MLAQIVLICTIKHDSTIWALEKLWSTQNPWFRIATTFIGIALIDCWKAFVHGGGVHHKQKVRVTDFAALVAWECLYNTYPGHDDEAGDAGEPGGGRKRGCTAANLSPIDGTPCAFKRIIKGKSSISTHPRVILKDFLTGGGISFMSSMYRLNLFE